jgi:hypothetical protein
MKTEFDGLLQEGCPQKNSQFWTLSYFAAAACGVQIQSFPSWSTAKEFENGLFPG